MLAAVENITIGESALLSVISMGIIMAVLAIIMGLIYIVSAVIREAKKRKSRSSAAHDEVAPAAAENAEPKAPGTCGELKLVKCSERDAAMIMAIVADNMQEDLNTLRFSSIKLIEDNETK